MMGFPGWRKFWKRTGSPKGAGRRRPGQGPPPRVERLEERTLLDGSLPDLVGAGFDVAEETALWGETAHVRGAVQNRGQAAAGSFTVELLLSPDPTFDATDRLLATFHLPGLAAGVTDTRTLTVTLPGAPGQ